MKYLKLIMITMVTVSLSLVGCGPKKGSESPTSPVQNQSKSDETKQNSVAAPQGEGALTPEEVASSIEAIKTLPQDEQVRRLRLEVASIVGGVLFFKASYPLQRAAQRAALYYAVLGRTQPVAALARVAMANLEMEQSANQRILNAYEAGIKDAVAKLRAADPNLSVRQARGRINNAYKIFQDASAKETQAMEKELAQKISTIEKDTAKQLVKARRGYLASRGFSFGARGMRYLSATLATVGTVWLMYDVFSGIMTSEMGDGEITAEDRLIDFERAMYNYRHDPENIQGQDQLIQACAASMPSIIEFLNLQVEHTNQTIEAIKNSTELKDEEKTAAISVKEAELKDLNGKLEIHKAMLGVVSSGNKEDSLKKITENMDSLLELHKKAEEGSKEEASEKEEESIPSLQGTGTSDSTGGESLITPLVPRPGIRPHGPVM